MIILDETYFPILIDNIEVPSKTDMFWTLNLEERDFMLSPLDMFEEITAKGAFGILINNFVLKIPAYWNILVFSEETSQLDIVDLVTVSRGHFTALIYNYTKNKITSGNISVIEYFDKTKIQTVSFNKNSMLCHGLGPDNCICIAPSDNYNKYLKDAVIGDLI